MKNVNGSIYSVLDPVDNRSFLNLIFCVETDLASYVAKRCGWESHKPLFFLWDEQEYVHTFK